MIFHSLMSMTLIYKKMAIIGDEKWRDLVTLFYIKKVYVLFRLNILAQTKKKRRDSGLIVTNGVRLD